MPRHGSRYSREKSPRKDMSSETHLSRRHTDSHADIFIKPEPVEHEHHNRKTGDYCGRRHKSKHDPSPPSDAPTRASHRLREPIVIKQENSHKKRRLHSPVVLHDEHRHRGSNQHSPDFQNQSDGRRSQASFARSGLLDQKNIAPTQRQRANFGLSGKLAEDSNTYKGVVIKYNEPEDARKPTEHWRLYTFKGNKTLPILHIHRQSGFLIGRDRKIADIPMDHPSISKQHAVLQYRFVRGMVRLYLIDLESANGTYLNNTRIEPRRYYELLEKDLIKFGYSSREYVLMTAQLDEDDEQQESEDPE
ncbi:hypothetical protein P879_01188 [Paragonimus westermani]|uniref:FHA domain-containing protein n=1 Tax=Paragonimus westermani TaxID=34504 RepID=A0A8T0DMS1_9TREM|nr:hypothetical protein P879_01188 [Paragonimus westermani]